MNTDSQTKVYVTAREVEHIKATLATILMEIQTTRANVGDLKREADNSIGDDVREDER